MSSHVYHEIFLHLNWHTKLDQPLLRDHMEEITHHMLRQKADRMKGVTLIELNGTETHVHLAIEIEPFVTISELVQELKGASSFEVNKVQRQRALEWQRGYGVVSFGKQNLPWVVDYIRRQKEQHASGRVEARLEQCDVDEPDRGDSESPAEAG